MYLYLFEIFDTFRSWQMPLPPSDADLQSVQDGYLQVFFVESGKFQKLNRDLKWENIPAGGRYPGEVGEYSDIKPAQEPQCTL